MSRPLLQILGPIFAKMCIFSTKKLLSTWKATLKSRLIGFIATIKVTLLKVWRHILAHSPPPLCHTKSSFWSPTYPLGESLQQTSVWKLNNCNIRVILWVLWAGSEENLLWLISNISRTKEAIDQSYPLHQFYLNSFKPLFSSPSPDMGRATCWFFIVFETRT